MQNNDFRAKQFMPFDALEGLRKMIKEAEKEVADKVVLSENLISEVNEKLKTINKKDTVELIYYKENNYIRKIVEVNKVDEINKALITTDEVIYFDNILNIK